MKTLKVVLVFFLVLVLEVPQLEAQTRWADDVRITDPSQSAGSPRLAALTDGTLYAACSLGGTPNAGLYRSDDGGASWALDRYITSSDPVTPISIIVAEGDAPGGQRLFVSLRASSGSTHELRVWWLDLTNGSTGYGVVASGDMSMQVSGGTLCVDDGDYPDTWRVYVAYEVFDNSSYYTDFRFALSTDQGATWTNHAGVGGVEGDYAGTDMAYGNGVLYYVYSYAWPFSPPEIRLRKSTNRGLSWGSYLTVETLGIASIWPTIVAAAGEPSVVVCFDDGIQDDLAVRVSHDAGLSWSPANPPNDPIEREYYPQLALDNQDEKLVLAWLQDDDLVARIKVSESDLNSPTTWTTPESVVDAGGDPGFAPPALTIDAAHDDAACVAWTDLREDPVQTIWFDTQADGPVEQIDQSQMDHIYGFWFDSEVVRWQEFAPSLNVLTAVEVYIQQMGQPGNLLLEIRTQDGALLGQELVMEDEIASAAWVRVEFSQTIILNTSSIYRIHVAADSPSSSPSHRYFWRGSTDSDYNPDCACSVQEGNQWPTFDFAFQTWGFFDPGALVHSPLPAECSLLLPNWPNPFNPSTTISFELPEGVTFRLNIYDVSGGLVRVLGQGTTETAGRHQFIWDGRDFRGKPVASGVYLYSLTAESLVETRRMVLVR